MTQKQELSSLLKTNNNGWNVDLFQDQNAMQCALCTNCNSICCDAVQLSCHPNDTEIDVYCKKCLEIIVKENDNKCPINSHSNAIIVENTAIRSQISEAIIMCPYCRFQGNINDLLSNHLEKCNQSQNELSKMNSKEGKSELNNNYKMNKLQKSFWYLIMIIIIAVISVFVISNLKSEMETLLSRNVAQSKTIENLNAEIEELESFYSDIADNFNSNLCSSGITISSNKLEISRKESDYSWNTCYGNLIIESMDNRTYIWKLRNQSPDDSGGIYIGIDNSAGRCVNTALWRNNLLASYVFHGYWGDLYSWDKDKRVEGFPKFNNFGDIMLMKLKFSEKSNLGVLSLKINDGNEFIVSKNILRQNNLKYRLAITMHYKNESIQIL